MSAVASCPSGRGLVVSWFGVAAGEAAPSPSRGPGAVVFGGGGRGRLPRASGLERETRGSGGVGVAIAAPGSCAAGAAEGTAPRWARVSVCRASSAAFATAPARRRRIFTLRVSRGAPCMVSGVPAATASASSGAPSAVFVVGVIVAVVTSLRASRAFRNASFRLADSMAFFASFSRARLIRCVRVSRGDMVHVVRRHGAGRQRRQYQRHRRSGRVLFPAQRRCCRRRRRLLLFRRPGSTFCSARRLLWRRQLTELSRLGARVAAVDRRRLPCGFELFAAREGRPVRVRFAVLVEDILEGGAAVSSVVGI